MSIASKVDRARARAARLQEEAGNCVGMAVAERDRAHAAALIDEAIRLTRRARELGAVDT